MPGLIFPCDARSPAARRESLRFPGCPAHAGGVAPPPSPLGVRVPASKSIEQRVRALAALCATPPRIVRLGEAPAGRDVVLLSRALDALGPWTDGSLGIDRRSLRLDLGLGATGLRVTTALAVLRPSGARTLVTGRPPLLARPHRPLRLALERLGAHVRRKPSGSLRVIAGGVRGGAVDVDGTRSSQYASALALIAPRLGGLTIRVRGPVVSAAYLDLTIEALRAFGVPARRESLGADVVLDVPGAEPTADVVTVPPDASAAAGRYAAAALAGESIVVPGLRRDGSQPDLAVLDVLEAMGATVDADPAGQARVTGPAGRLRAAGEVDLRASPDLLPVLAALAATADGTTRFVGAPHLKHKETDRRVTVARGIEALGGDATVTDDGLVVRGTALHPGTVAVGGDHRLAFAFAVLARCVPGVRLEGASAASKSDPWFLADVLGPCPGEG